MSGTTTPPSAFFSEVKALIEAVRQRVAVAVNAGLTRLYWQVGNPAAGGTARPVAAGVGTGEPGGRRGLLARRKTPPVAGHGAGHPA